MMACPVEPEHPGTRPDVRRVVAERRARQGHPGWGVEDTAWPDGRTPPLGSPRSPWVQLTGGFPTCRSRRGQSGKKVRRAKDELRLLISKCDPEVR